MGQEVVGQQSVEGSWSSVGQSHVPTGPLAPVTKHTVPGRVAEHKKVEGRGFLEWENITPTCEPNVITYYLRLSGNKQMSRCSRL